VRNINGRKISTIAIISFIFLIQPFLLASASESPTIEWSKTFGGKKYDAATHHIQTIDGGYAITGSTSSLGPRGQNFWLVKTSNNGTIDWNKAYGGKGDDFAYAIIQTDDLGFAIAGATTSFDTQEDFDFLLIKTNSTGDVEWYKTYGGLFDDHATALIKTTDGGYAIVGVSNTSVNGNDFLLIKIDSKGIIEWSKTYGGAGEEKAWSLIQIQGNGFVVSGSTTSYGSGSSDVWLVKTDQNGTMQWNRTFGGKDEESAQSIILTTDGGFALGGETRSFGSGNYDFWLVKTDQNGTMQWNRTFGGKDEDSARAIIQTTDGGYLLGGFSEQVFYYDFFLVKTNPHGYMQWNKNFSFGTDEKAYSLIQTTDGNYSMAGPSQSRQGYNFFMVKTNNSNVTVDNLFPVADAGDDKSVFVGESVSFNGSAFDPDGNISLIRWDFDGDGIYDFESNKTGSATFIYTEEGTYRAFFEVTDNNGSHSLDMQEIIVESKETGFSGEVSERDVFFIVSILILLAGIAFLWYASINEKIKKYVLKNLSFLKIDIWLYRLTLSFFIIIFIKLIYSYFIHSSWIYFDEPAYGIIAHNIFNGEFAIIGKTAIAHPYPAGYSYLLAPTYLLGNNMEVVFQGMLVINCILSTLIVFPVFFIMKKFVTTKISFLTSLLVATLPVVLVHNFVLMSENALYLLFLLSCFLTVKVFTYKETNWKFYLLCLLLGFSVLYLILIKATALCMVPALLCVFIYKLVKNRKINTLKYSVIFAPFLPFIGYILYEGSRFTTGYNISGYIKKISLVFSDSTHLTDFVTITFHEISYFVLMTYIVSMVFVIFLFIYWKKIPKKKRECLSYFMIYSLISIFLLIMLTSLHIYRGKYDIYTRYVSTGLPIIIMLGMIGIDLFRKTKKQIAGSIVTVLFMILSIFVIFVFPTKNYKIVNDLDLVWVTYLQKQHLFGINGADIFFIFIGILVVVLTYLLIIKIFFKKDFLFQKKSVKHIHIIVVLIVISLILYIPNAHMALEKDNLAENRGFNKPAQWLMRNDPDAYVLMEDSYSAFSGGGMGQEYWDFMYADMQFWFSDGHVFVTSKDVLNQLIQSENIDFNYIVSTHDLTSKYKSVADFYMNVEPMKRQENVDWHIYEIN